MVVGSLFAYGGNNVDADKIRLGETGFEDLLLWLRRSGEPQNLESLTYQYIAILRDKVLREEA